MSRAGDTFSFSRESCRRLIGAVTERVFLFFILNRSILCRYKMNRDIKGRRSSWRSSRVEFCRCTAKERERKCCCGRAEESGSFLCLVDGMVVEFSLAQVFALPFSLPTVHWWRAWAAAGRLPSRTLDGRRKYKEKREGERRKKRKQGSPFATEEN